jgi:hypothetical protein
LDHTVVAITQDYITETMPLDTIDAFDAVSTFFICLIALVLSLTILWNFSVLQRAHHSSHVFCNIKMKEVNGCLQSRRGLKGRRIGVL